MLSPHDSDAANADGVGESTDAVFGGAVTFVQPTAGYRVNQDSLILAAFAVRGRTRELVFDLGAGVGVVGLVLHHLGVARELVLIERDPRLAVLAERNLHGMKAPGRVVRVDLHDGLPESLQRRATLVVSNPPFFTDERHVPSDASRRHSRHGALQPFVRAARDALSGNRARAAIAYPARALDTLLETARGVGLVAKRLRLVHPFACRPARLALVELRIARPGGLVVEAPLVEWDRPGLRSAELNELIEGGRT